MRGFSKKSKEDNVKYLQENLEPCPLCGCSSLDCVAYSPSFGYQKGDWRVKIECPECGLTIERQNTADAAVAWNRRVTDG